jgi:hypothetical protein
VRYTIKNFIDTDVDTFWKELFFNAEFNRTLFMDYLHFKSYAVVEDRKDPDGVVHRRIQATPNVELPVAAQKILGGNAGYTEIGRYDPAQRKYFIEAIPNMGADRVKTKCELWVEPRGEKRCERVVTVDNTVRVFGLGTLIEGYIEQQARDSYGRAAEFTNRWIREKGL